jgi:uncharacterized repeat protein (TIGR01451 family)
MKIFNKIRSLSRKAKVTAAVLAIALGVAIPAVHAEFYPNRPTFDYNKFDPSVDCSDTSNPAAQNSRCGSMTGPVFNSFINTPSYGDERPFFDARLSDAGVGTNNDPVQNVTEDAGKEVTLRVYVHNNANQSTDCLPVHLDANGVCTQIDNDAVGIARNAKVSITLPTATAASLRARADISASNATKVEDTVDMTAGEPFTVNYVPGSAVLLRNNISHPLSDNIVNGGALIGNDVMDGNLPGCFDFAALVEVKVKITPKPTPNLQLVKQVKVKGDANWSKNVTTKPGADVQWLLSTKDVSNATLTNVIVRDVLPPHVKLVPGSVRLVNTSGDKVQQDGPLFAGGFNVGNYAPGGTQYAIFDTTTLDDFSGCSVTIENVAHAHSDQTPNELTDVADVTIQKTNCNQPQTPTFSCDLLTVTPGDNRTATFTTTASAAGGAQIALYKYDFGDGTPVLMTDKPSVTHTYAKDGQYAARVSVQVNLNNDNNDVKVVTSDKCAAAVTFTTPPPNTPPNTPTAPGQPTSLVNTGPGSVAAIFTAATILGAAAYRRMLSHRLSRQQ